MTAGKEIVISARSLKKVFCMGETVQTVFENVNLDIYRGDFTIIMGASGAGKSTLMYALSGMDKTNIRYGLSFSGKEITNCTDDQLAVFRRKNCRICFSTDLSIG